VEICSDAVAHESRAACSCNVRAWLSVIWKIFLQVEISVVCDINTAFLIWSSAKSKFVVVLLAHYLVLVRWDLLKGVRPKERIVAVLLVWVYFLSRHFT